METKPLTEPRKRRLKRKQRAWPHWLRSKYLIRWLFVIGPFVYRVYKFVLFILGTQTE